ncbi:hypothetical protein DSO57_1022762 [Entomophthora muscae]|uniref:Uncharacterized protein n=1 Tax=Entomophthora muscae TaxID=34485 RepID=A0ACC2SG40_9FUNG|nr:hypothetical protein DSO57_1022762 [Entomophthora muscae]
MYSYPDQANTEGLYLCPFKPARLVKAHLQVLPYTDRYDNEGRMFLEASAGAEWVSTLGENDISFLALHGSCGG